MAEKYKSENRIQQECYMWFHNQYPYLRGLLFAVPNGGARSSREGKLLKDTGVVPGVSDMLLLYDGITTCFELKTEVGEQSQLQVKWEKKVNRHKFNYYIIRNLEQFKLIIKDIIPDDNIYKYLPLI